MSAHSDDENDNNDFLYFAEGDRLSNDFSDYDYEPFRSVGGKVKEVVGENQNQQSYSQANNKGKAVVSESVGMESDGGSELLKSPYASEDDKRGVEFPEFFEKRDTGTPELKLGMLFASVKVFRAALGEHAIRNGYDFKFLKNEGTRVTVVCISECS